MHKNKSRGWNIINRLIKKRFNNFFTDNELRNTLIHKNESRGWNIINKLITKGFNNFFTKRELVNIVAKQKENQKKIMGSLLKNAGNTRLGKKYGFKEIQSFQDFQTKIPVFDYEDFFDERIIPMLKGEKDVSYPGEIPQFARTGGTTSRKEKYIPITKESIKTNHIAAPKLMMKFYCTENTNTKLFTGKMITIGGGFQPNPYTGKKNIGYISGILQKEAPLPAKVFKEPKEKIAFETNREEKVANIIRKTKHKNITGIAGIPLRCSIILREMLKNTDKTNIHDIRPNFELFITGGTRFEPYREEFNQLWNKDKVNVWQVYNASEGFFAIQIENNAQDMFLLTNHGVFYEFIELEKYNKIKKNKKKIQKSTINLNGIKKNQEYVIIISTNAGLRRYILGDTIKFTSTKPYKIQITGRTKFFIDAFNEHTLLDHTEKAIESACKKTNCIIKEYTVGVNMKEKRYEWIIEFSNKPKNTEIFATELDTALQQANDNYRAKRDGIKEGKVYIAPTGTFERRFASQGKSGGQSKVPKLANDIKYIKEILKLIP